MKDWRRFFKGKKITVLGLGLLGRAVGDTKFLAEQGADLIVTDLKDEKALQASLKGLKGFTNIAYHLGGHDFADFKNRDFILKGAGVPLDSPYVAEARKNGIPIKMSASWFAEIANIPFVGVTGTRGKSTVTHLLYDIMRAAHSTSSGQAGMEVLLGGNVRGVSTLALLPKVTKDSIALMELDSWQCQGFGEVGLSPNVAVFTNLMQDHVNYYADSDRYLGDKAWIFLNQKPEDTLVVGAQALPILKEQYGRKICSRVVIADPAKFPKAWKLKIPGEHNVANTMCAVEAARALGIDDEVIRTAVEDFKGVSGRLELVREVKGVKIYNDNSATTPEATIAALRAIGNTDRKDIVLIMGGDEKNLDMSELIAEIPKWCSKVVLFKERGTERIRDAVFALNTKGVAVYEEEGLERCVERARSIAESGETILYSPAFSSFGKYFKNEFDRGDQFVAAVKNL